MAIFVLSELPLKERYGLQYGSRQPHVTEKPSTGSRLKGAAKARRVGLSVRY